MAENANKDAVVVSFNDSLLHQSDIRLLEGPCWINDKIIGFCFEYFEREVQPFCRQTIPMIPFAGTLRERSSAILPTNNSHDSICRYFEREKFSHSADKLCLISPEVAQFIKLAPAEDLGEFLNSLNLGSKQFVFLALNDNESFEQAGGSHWSLLVYIRNKQEFRHYDSLYGGNKEIAKMLAYKLQPFVQAPRGRMKVLEMDGPKQQNSYDCGVFVISVAEHLCRELCEGYNISLNDIVDSDFVSKKRFQLIELIHNVAQEFGSFGS